MRICDMSEDELAVEEFGEGALEFWASIGDHSFWGPAATKPCFAEGEGHTGGVGVLANARPSYVAGTPTHHVQLCGVAPVLGIARLLRVGQEHPQHV